MSDGGWLPGKKLVLASVNDHGAPTQNRTVYRPNEPKTWLLCLSRCQQLVDGVFLFSRSSLGVVSVCHKAKWMWHLSPKRCVFPVRYGLLHLEASFFSSYVGVWSTFSAALQVDRPYILNYERLFPVKTYRYFVSLHTDNKHERWLNSPPS